MISIIIPSLNRCKALNITLQSIAAQSDLTGVEILIIDNGSEDDTKLISELYIKQNLPIYYHYNDMPGLLTGRHYGATLAKGNLLCFIDDDVILNEHYIKNLNQLIINEPQIELATGPCLPQYECDPPNWINSFWDEDETGKFCSWLSLIDLGNQIKEIDPNLVWGLNFVIKKDTLIRLGGFNPDCIPKNLQHFQGDGETGLTIKAKTSDVKAYYLPGISLLHQVGKERMTFEYFKNRAFYQGVCNSFTNIRNHHFSFTKNNSNSFFKKIRNFLHPYYKWIKPNRKQIILTDEILEMQIKLKNEEKNGYLFHQNAFNTNKKVKDWVLKENYWDYKLPI